MRNFNRKCLFVACVALLILNGDVIGTVYGQGCASAEMKYLAESNGRPNPGNKCTDTGTSIWYLKSTSGIAQWSRSQSGTSSDYSESGHDDGTISTISPETLSNGQPDNYNISEAQYSALSTTINGAGECGSSSPYVITTGNKNVVDGTWTIVAFNVNSGTSGSYTKSSVFQINGGAIQILNTCKNTVSTYNYTDNVMKISEMVRSKLESPYTESQLKEHVIGVIPPYPNIPLAEWPSGTGGKAFYDRGSDGSDVSCGRMKYFVQVPCTIKDAIYTVEWSQITTVDGIGSAAPKSIKITGTGDPINPVMGDVQIVEVPGTPSTITETSPVVTDVKFPDSGDGGGGGGGGGGPGHGGPHHGGNMGAK